MRQVRWASGTVAVALALALCGGPATADTAADRAAAIVVYPDILVDIVTQPTPTVTVDTVIQLSNTSTQPVVAWCFYENANSHCSNTGQVCVEPSECCFDTVGCGTCVPGWNEVDFRVRLTPLQPIGWRASEGLVDFPLDGVRRVGRGGSSNAGSRIPPVPEDPFDGELKCIAVNEDHTPTDRNVLKGESTRYYFDSSTGMGHLDVAKHNAVGVLAMEGAVNDDKVLTLGGEDAEYNGCPNVLILNHFFDFAVNPVSGAEITTRLVLVPCTQDLLRQIPGEAVVQYLVYNEFEQRFSTSRTVTCKQGIFISEIDTTQRERSIFAVGVAGTLAGQTRMTPIGSGLLGIADEYHDNDNGGPYTAQFQLNIQGQREVADLITLP